MAGVAEVYLPAFGLALGMSVVPAGLLASVPLVAGGVLQLLAPRAIQRVRSLRCWVAACTAVQGLAFLPLVMVALTGVRPTGIIFVAASVYWAAGMGQAAGWTPWMTRVVPARLRGRFFARRMGLVQAAMLIGLLGAGAALHACAGTPRVLDVYAGMFGLACVARLISAFAIWRQGEHVDRGPRRRMRLRSIPPKLRGTRRGALLAYLIAALAAAAIAGPFVTPYLLAYHELAYVQYSAFTATIIVVKIAALPVIGRILHRVGLQRVITVSALAIAPIPMLWWLSDSFWWFLVIQAYSGLAWAGFELGMLMALFDAEDDAERTTTQVAFSALQALGTAGASLIGGAVLGALGSDHDAYLAVFVVSAIARLFAAMLIVRQLRQLFTGVPLAVMTRAWTLALRPWGGTVVGTIVRPLVNGIGRFRRRA